MANYAYPRKLNYTRSRLHPMPENCTLRPIALARVRVRLFHSPTFHHAEDSGMFAGTAVPKFRVKPSGSSGALVARPRRRLRLFRLNRSFLMIPDDGVNVNTTTTSTPRITLTFESTVCQETRKPKLLSGGTSFVCRRLDCAHAP